MASPEFINSLIVGLCEVQWVPTIWNNFVANTENELKFGSLFKAKAKTYIKLTLKMK